MTALLSIFLAISAVKQPATPLRDACGADGDVIATLEAGAPVQIRFSLAGESVPCYKVTVEVGGKKLEGYLPASAISGLEDFEKGLRDAAWPEAQQVIRAATAAAMPSLAGANAATAQAAQLIESSQPAKALVLLENELRKKSDPNVLTLAGVAAWKSDDAQRALIYWKNALAIRPNPDLERLYRRVEKENAGDQSTAKLYGLRVLLRYDSNLVPAETARLMLAALDEQFTRVSGELGCAGGERLVAIVQSREAYHKSTDAAEWSGGQYDGRIRVPVAGPTMDKELLRIFAHESTHACLSLTGHWPAWLQEGMAQKLSGDVLSAGARTKLDKLAREGKLPKLENLRQDWSRMDAEHAAQAYALSLAAVDAFYELHANLGIRNLLSNPERLPSITADLDKRLGL